LRRAPAVPPQKIPERPVTNVFSADERDAALELSRSERVSLRCNILRK
jgi:hypothetical protein